MTPKTLLGAISKPSLFFIIAKINTLSTPLVTATGQQLFCCTPVEWPTGDRDVGKVSGGPILVLDILLWGCSVLRLKIIL